MGLDGLPGGEGGRAVRGQPHGGGELRAAQGEARADLGQAQQDAAEARARLVEIETDLLRAQLDADKEKNDLESAVNDARRVVAAVTGELTETRATVQVMAGVLCDAQGRVLLAERDEDVMLLQSIEARLNAPVALLRASADAVTHFLGAGEADFRALSDVEDALAAVEDHTEELSALGLGDPGNLTFEEPSSQEKASAHHNLGLSGAG